MITISAKPASNHIVVSWFTVLAHTNAFYFYECVRAHSLASVAGNAATGNYLCAIQMHSVNGRLACCRLQRQHQNDCVQNSRLPDYLARCRHPIFPRIAMLRQRQSEQKKNEII